MKLKEGDRVIFRLDKALAINTTQTQKRREEIGYITGVHPEDENPYDISNAAGDVLWVGDDDVIVRKIIPRCDCGAKMMYHDQEEIRICPFCDL